jgi:fructose-specific phosphotransferase system IIA component
MKIADFLAEASIELNVKVETKAELIELLMDLAVKSGNVISKEDALKEIFKREDIMSTGVGKEIAMPHAKTNAVKSTVGALAILSEPLDFDSLDKEPVTVAFLILGREDNVGNHLRVLSKVSRMFNNDGFKQKVHDSANTKEVLDTFAEFDQAI